HPGGGAAPVLAEQRIRLQITRDVGDGVGPIRPSKSSRELTGFDVHAGTGDASTMPLADRGGDPPRRGHLRKLLEQLAHPEAAAAVAHAVPAGIDDDPPSASHRPSLEVHARMRRATFTAMSSVRSMDAA